jgi:hypothetical protein
MWAMHGARSTMRLQHLALVLTSFHMLLELTGPTLNAGLSLCLNGNTVGGIGVNDITFQQCSFPGTRRVNVAVISQ